MALAVLTLLMHVAGFAFLFNHEHPEYLIPAPDHPAPLYTNGSLAKETSSQPPFEPMMPFISYSAPMTLPERSTLVV